MSIIAGKEKAWAPSIAVFLIALILQRTGQGEGPTPDQTADLIAIGTEILTSAIAAGITFISSYVATDSRFVKRVDEEPKQPVVAENVNGPYFDNE